MGCHKKGKRNFWLQERQRSNTSPSPTSSHEAADCAQAKAPSYMFRDEKAGLWVSTAHEHMQISGQRYQTANISVDFFLLYQTWLPQVAPSTKDSIYYKLLIRYTALPKNYLRDLAMYFKSLENK